MINARVVLHANFISNNNVIIIKIVSGENKFKN